MSYADLTSFYQMHLTLHLNFRLRHFDPYLCVDTHQNLSLGIEPQPSLVPPVNDNIVTEDNYTIFSMPWAENVKIWQVISTILSF